MTPLSQASHPALVARQDVGAPTAGCYLQLGPSGAAAWTPDPTAATAFASMREALRAATRLPCGLRPFGVPRHAASLAARELN